MNRLHLFASLILCSLVLTACSKDPAADTNGIPENAIMLSTEGFHNETKTSVQAFSVDWVSGDVVRIINSQENDRTVTVVPATGEAYIGEALGGSGAMRGYYPLSIITADGASDHATSPTIVVPDRYESHYSNGRQVIALPMIATADEGATDIQFQHVTAAVRVIVRNDMDFALTLDSVVVSSTAYKLSGIVNPNLTVSPDLNIAAQTGSGSVTVRFSDSPSIAADRFDTVQVPILPIGESQLTVEVYAHSKVGTVLNLQNVTNANYYFHYSCTPSSNTPALGRNTMATARIALKRSANTEAPATMEEIDHSLFTINGSDGKVRFSKGNLVYSNGTWSFHTNQYDRCFTADGDASSSYTSSGTFDLFGWGTSGHNFGSGYGSAYQPWSTSTTAADYGPIGQKDLTGDFANGDWGVENTIGSDAAGTWRTFTKEEWLYLLNTRSASTINGTTNARYTEAKINTDGTSVNGLIIFPDNYTAGTPNGVTWGTINAASSWVTGTTCTTEGWKTLESAGCVFLPTSGYRSGTTITISNNRGGYWSSSAYDKEKAYRFYFYSNYLQLNIEVVRDRGSAVRLVRDAN